MSHRSRADLETHPGVICGKVEFVFRSINTRGRNTGITTTSFSAHDPDEWHPAGSQGQATVHVQAGRRQAQDEEKRQKKASTGTLIGTGKGPH